MHLLNCGENMVAIPKQKMTVDEFLVWSEQTPGRYELVDGLVITMQSEKVVHVRVKQRVLDRLRSGLLAAGLAHCEAFPDGVTVRISKHTAYEPDALVYCGPRIDGDSLEVPNPVIVVEVLSPSTALRDVGEKLSGYFSLTSVHHVLIVNPEKLPVIHHARQTDGKILTSLVSSGSITLDPPGITVSVDNLLEVSETP